MSTRVVFWPLIEHTVNPGCDYLWILYPPIAVESVCGDIIIYTNFLSK